MNLHLFISTLLMSNELGKDYKNIEGINPQGWMLKPPLLNFGHRHSGYYNSFLRQELFCVKSCLDSFSLLTELCHAKMFLYANNTSVYYFHMGIQSIWWHVYVTTQVIKVLTNLNNWINFKGINVLKGKGACHDLMVSPNIVHTLFYLHCW